MDEVVPRYHPQEFEAGWAKRWVADGTFAADDASSKPRFYALDMFPYPSGDLHMGHLEAFTGGDVVARFSWMRGFEVLHPIGWDAFGLPAENAASQRGIDPREWTYANIAQQAESFKRLGMSFDWSRRLNTCDPEYYRWTQWLFLRLHERDLAYRKAAPANWCPSCHTVLANEQVIQGLCERCDTPVTKRDLTQWFFRITDYAQRLLDDMEQLDGWTDRVLTMQRNWIGRSEGADVTFTVAGTADIIEFPVFTTRPDTLWGATFMVLAPEHALARSLCLGDAAARFDGFLDEVRRRSEIERSSTGKEKIGLFTGSYAINPVNSERIPIWLADYVLLEYGTGAIMAVPAHDDRDFEFARQYGLDVRVVIQPPGGTLDGVTMTEPYIGPGVMVNSGHFDGSPVPESVDAVIKWLDAEGRGRAAVRFRLRDWLISRQRSWGAPIPIVYCAVCGEVPVPDEQLPVELPSGLDWSRGELSPLARHPDFAHTSCPRCGGEATRDTDTMDTFVDSSWYFMRYCSPGYPHAAFDPHSVAKWMPVDQYTGGIEHAILHLLYARFITKVCHDMDLVPFIEPFPRLMNQGQVIMDGAAMSKSRGNLVAPKEIVDTFGVDTARVTILFAGPFDADIDWADVSPSGIFRWLGRVWRLSMEHAAAAGAGDTATGVSPLRRATHKAIKGVTEDTERFKFNTAISKLQVLTNAIGEHGPSAPAADVGEAVRALVQLLAPYAPFITEELWSSQLRFGDGSVHRSEWPSFDAALVVDDTVTCAVQVNGKLRATLTVDAGIGEGALVEAARANEHVASYLSGGELIKTVARPPKLVNFVVR
jgi:leucyl-tRNA synthetase